MKKPIRLVTQLAVAGLIPITLGFMAYVGVEKIRDASDRLH